jgi:hypothetical protein
LGAGPGSEFVGSTISCADLSSRLFIVSMIDELRRPHQSNQ